jgi:DNA repair exonuclease SbcCD ATPase subunit
MNHISDTDAELERLRSMRERVQHLREKIQEIKEHIPQTSHSEEHEETFRRIRRKESANRNLRTV